jgi:hypothetical protein
LIRFSANELMDARVVPIALMYINRPASPAFRAAARTFRVPSYSVAFTSGSPAGRLVTPAVRIR